MNKRQKKKFEKKLNHKKYGPSVYYIFKRNDDGTLDITEVTTDKHNRRIAKAVKYLECYPASNSEHKEEPKEIEVSFKTKPYNFIDDFDEETREKVVNNYRNTLKQMNSLMVENEII